MDHKGFTRTNFLNFFIRTQTNGNRKNLRGFTLIELLLVIAIISILVVVVFAALNPPQRFRDARNARRSTDVETILTAVHEFIIDNRGTLPSGMSAGMAERQLGTAASGCATTNGNCNVSNAACLDLSASLAAYLKTIPVDPSLATNSANTNYSIIDDTNGIVTIKACGAESTIISTSR